MPLNFVFLRFFNITVSDFTFVPEYLETHRIYNILFARSGLTRLDHIVYIFGAILPHLYTSLPVTQFLTVSSYKIFLILGTITNNQI